MGVFREDYPNVHYGPLLSGYRPLDKRGGWPARGLVYRRARFTDSLDQKVFPAMLVSMASIGEGGGLLGEMLDKVADHYERETEELVASLASLAEPILIVFLGVVVGSIVIGMFLASSRSSKSSLRNNSPKLLA